MAIILITALLVVIMLGLSFLSYLSENNLLDFSKELINPELLYDIVYNRKSENSLISAFDRSIHLVTRNKNYPTEKRNLNFIFSDDKIWDDF